jgi:hypothetical protein
MALAALSSGQKRHKLCGAVWLKPSPRVASAKSSRGLTCSAHLGAFAGKHSKVTRSTNSSCSCILGASHHISYAAFVASRTQPALPACPCRPNPCRQRQRHCHPCRRRIHYRQNNGRHSWLLPMPSCLQSSPLRSQMCRLRLPSQTTTTPLQSAN